MTQKNLRPLAVLHPWIEAKELAELKAVSIRGVLPLVPDQKFLLRGENWPVVDPYDVYTFRFHQKVLVRLRKFRRRLEDRLLATKLSEAGKANLITCCLQAAATMWRLQLLLRGKGPWLLYGEGAWREFTDLHAACALLYPQLSPPSAGNPNVELSEPHESRWLLAFLEWKRARLLRRKKVAVISTLAQGFVPLSQYFLSLAPDTWMLQSPLRRVSKSCRADIAALTAPPREKHEWGDRQSLLEFQGDNRVFRRAREEVRAVLKGIDETFLKVVCEVHGENFSNEIGHGESVVPALTKTLKAAAIKQVLLYDICQPERLWLAESARRAGVERWQFAHMSVADYASSATLWEAYRRRVTMIAASPLASHVFAQSPSAFGIISRLDPKAQVRKVRPIIWCLPKEVPKAKFPTSERTILFAGNYDSWNGYQPIINETVDDYVAGITTLARVVSEIPNIRLIIRFKVNFKSKGEIGKEALAAMLPKNGNWEIRDQRTFYDDLAESDLMVSFSSTVLEEAVHYGYPVLLWGGRMPYRLLTAQDTPPTPEKTSAVYACKQPEDLRQMLDAILDCHANRSLTEAEQAPYVWGKFPGRARLVKELLGQV